MRTAPRTMLLLIAVLASCVPCLAGPDEDALAARLDPVLNRLAKTGAVLHARVIEVSTRREIYARRPDEPCTPASNFKLLTSATGLDLFGTNRTFKTYLAMDGDNLCIIGTGDPGIGDPRLAKARNELPTTVFDRWAEALRRRGIEHVRGDLVFDDWAFETLRTHPSWPRGWLLHWYATPVAGLNFSDNCVDFTVLPGESGGPARYEVMPPVRDIRVTNECITGGRSTTSSAPGTSRPSRRGGGSPSVTKSPGGNNYRLSGGCTTRTG